MPPRRLPVRLTPGLSFALLLLLLAGMPASPASAATDVKISKGTHTIIPFEIRDSHMLFRGRINGKDSVQIVVDTGASRSVMDAELARRLGLKVVGEHEAHGAGGPQRTIEVADVTIELPGLRIYRDQISSMDFTPVAGPSGSTLEVVVGYELFRDHIVVLDYEAGVMEVWEPKAFQWPREGTVVPMTLIQNLPYIDAAVALSGRAPLAGRFVLDSGSSGAVMLSLAGAPRDSAIASFPRTREIGTRGVGGELKNVIGRAEALTFGGMQLDHPIVFCPAPGPGAISAAGTLGNLGGQVLRRFRVTFDYANQRILFQPNRSFASRFDVDMSGAIFRFDAEQRAARVTRVDPGTPAETAGLQVGDLVESLDGQPIVTLGFSEFRERLKVDGREVGLGVRRGEESLALKCQLRRLL